MRSDQDESLPTSALFGFLAATLGEISARLERLEEHAGSMIHGSPRRQELLIVLQDFDLLRQMTEDCANLCAAATRQGGKIDRNLAGMLRLDALRANLRNHASPSSSPRSVPSQESQPAGTLDLFTTFIDQPDMM